jgi:hypothetical protein
LAKSSEPRATTSAACIKTSLPSVDGDKRGATLRISSPKVWNEMQDSAI